MFFKAAKYLLRVFSERSEVASAPYMSESRVLYVADWQMFLERERKRRKVVSSLNPSFGMLLLQL